MKVMRQRSILLGVAFAIAGAATGASLVLSSASSGSRVDATGAFSVFRDTPVAAAPLDLTEVHALQTAQFAKTHESGRKLGRFNSRLLIFPMKEDRGVCSPCSVRPQKIPVHRTALSRTTPLLRRVWRPNISAFWGCNQFVMGRSECNSSGWRSMMWRGPVSKLPVSGAQSGSSTTASISICRESLSIRWATSRPR
jgi:hypothetical protein